MKVRLFGMKQIYLMPFGDQRAQGLFLWNTIHLRYHRLQAHNLTSYVLFSSKIHYDYILKDSIKSVVFLFPYKLPINMKAFFLSQALKHNGTLYAHAFFARSGYPPDPSDPEYQPLAAFGRTHRKILSMHIRFIFHFIIWWHLGRYKSWC